MAFCSNPDLLTEEPHCRHPLTHACRPYTDAKAHTCPSGYVDCDFDSTTQTSTLTSTEVTTDSSTVSTSVSDTASSSVTTSQTTTPVTTPTTTSATLQVILIFENNPASCQEVLESNPIARAQFGSSGSESIVNVCDNSDELASPCVVLLSQPKCREAYNSRRREATMYDPSVIYLEIALRIVEPEDRVLEAVKQAVNQNRVSATVGRSTYVATGSLPEKATVVLALWSEPGTVVQDLAPNPIAEDELGLLLATSVAEALGLPANNVGVEVGIGNTIGITIDFPTVAAFDKKDAILRQLSSPNFQFFAVYEGVNIGSGAKVIPSSTLVVSASVSSTLQPATTSTVDRSDQASVKDDDEIEWWHILLIVVAVLLCCCCCLLFIVAWRRKQEEKMAMAPMDEPMTLEDWWNSGKPEDAGDQVVNMFSAADTGGTRQHPAFHNPHYYPKGSAEGTEMWASPPGENQSMDKGTPVNRADTSMGHYYPGRPGSVDSVPLELPDFDIPSGARATPEAGGVWSTWTQDGMADTAPGSDAFNQAVEDSLRPIPRSATTFQAVRPAVSMSDFGAHSNSVVSPQIGGTEPATPIGKFDRMVSDNQTGWDGETSNDLVGNDEDVTAIDIEVRLNKTAAALNDGRADLATDLLQPVARISSQRVAAAGPEVKGPRPRSSDQYAAYSQDIQAKARDNWDAQPDEFDMFATTVEQAAFLGGAARSSTPPPDSIGPWAPVAQTGGFFQDAAAESGSDDSSFIFTADDNR